MTTRIAGRMLACEGDLDAAAIAAAAISEMGDPPRVYRWVWGTGVADGLVCGLDVDGGLVLAIHPKDFVALGGILP
jgi:hypothetical protein